MRIIDIIKEAQRMDPATGNMVDYPVPRDPKSGHITNKSANAPENWEKIENTQPDNFFKGLVKAVAELKAKNTAPQDIIIQLSGIAEPAQIQMAIEGNKQYYWYNRWQNDVQLNPPLGWDDKKIAGPITKVDAGNAIEKDKDTLGDFIQQKLKDQEERENGVVVTPVDMDNVVGTPLPPLEKKDSVKDPVKDSASIWPIEGSIHVNRPFNMSTGHTHYGTDLRASSGTKILAPVSGKILVVASDSEKCGGTITLSNGTEQHRFCHLKDVSFVKQGEQVKQGQVIALSGGGAGDKGRGNATGPHLHWEMKIDGHLINPVKFHNSENLEPKEKPEVKTTPEVKPPPEVKTPPSNRQRVRPD